MRISSFLFVSKGGIMKQYRKKRLRAVFAGSLFLGSVMPIYAETVINQGSTGITPSRGNNGYSLRYKTVNGDPAYCLEAGTVVSLEPEAYEVTDLGSYGGQLHSGKVLSEAERAEIGEIAYFSYGYDGRDAYEWYAAAQDLIWQITDGGGTFFEGCGLEDHEQAIRESIAAYHREPSFHVFDSGKEVTKDETGVYPVTAGNTVTVKDDAGILKEYEILSVSGAVLIDEDGSAVPAASADLSAGQFRLKADDLNAVTVEMRRKAPAPQAPVLLFSENGDQKMIVRGYLTSLSPVTSTLQLRPQEIDIPILKTDPDGDPVSGAQLSVSGEDGTVIDTWITDGQPHRLDASRLRPGETWQLTEMKAPAGYLTADPVSFTVPDTAAEPVTIVMTDEKLQVRVLKKDMSGELLEGAVMRLYEKGSDTVLEEWTTVREPHDISALVEEGHTYVVRETECPAGYAITAEKEFTVSKGMKEITVEMTDEANDIVFRKTDPEGRPLAGARFEIRTESGETVASWTSDDREEGVRTTDDGRVIAKLLKGNETYILHETEAPFGCRTAEDSTFTMTGTVSDPQEVIIEDACLPFELKVYKYAADNKEHMLEGAEFTVFRYADDTPAKTPEGKTAAGRTDENGLLSFTLLYDPEGYYLRETKAPEGYVRSEDVIPVCPKPPFDFTQTYEVRVENRPHTPVTGDAAHDWVKGLLISLAAAGAVGVFLVRKRSY